MGHYTDSHPYRSGRRTHPVLHGIHHLATAPWIVFWRPPYALEWIRWQIRAGFFVPGETYPPPGNPFNRAGNTRRFNGIPGREGRFSAYITPVQRGLHGLINAAHSFRPERW